MIRCPYALILDQQIIFCGTEAHRHASVPHFRNSNLPLIRSSCSICTWTDILEGFIFLPVDDFGGFVAGPYRMKNKTRKEQ